MNIQITTACIDDLDAAAFLLKQQLDEHGAKLSASELRAALEAVILNSDLGFLLIARFDDHIAGCAYVSFVWALEHAGKSAWLEELYVEPGFRGRGIGAALLDTAISIAESAHCAAMDLEVDEAHSGVTGLYERHGFINLGRQRFALKLHQ